MTAHSTTMMIETPRGPAAGTRRRAPNPGAAPPVPPDPDHLPLQQLLELCLRSGDEILWTAFIRRSQPLINGVIIKTVRSWITPSPSLVEDLAQETYLKLCANDFRVLRRFGAYHENALYGFLQAIAANTVRDYFRGAWSLKRWNGRPPEDIDRVLLREEGIDSLFENVEQSLLLREIDACLVSHAAVETLRRDCAIFWLYYREGLTAKAISQLAFTGLSVKGVESAILRMTRLVRSKLGGTDTDT